mgnify:CR=1 FL=1
MTDIFFYLALLFACLWFWAEIRRLDALHEASRLRGFLHHEREYARRLQDALNRWATKPEADNAPPSL